MRASPSMIHLLCKEIPLELLWEQENSEKMHHRSESVHHVIAVWIFHAALPFDVNNQNAFIPDVLFRKSCIHSSFYGILTHRSICTRIPFHCFMIVRLHYELHHDLRIRLGIDSPFCWWCSWWSFERRFFSKSSSRKCWMNFWLELLLFRQRDEERLLG